MHVSIFYIVQNNCDLIVKPLVYRRTSVHNVFFSNGAVDRVVRGVHLYVFGDTNIDDFIQVEVHVGGGLGVEGRIGRDC